MPFANPRGRRAYVYILSNRKRNVFYVGVTSQLKKRVHDHKEGRGSVFTGKYRTKDLMYYELHECMQDAIAREKQLKRWKRAWKIALIKRINPALVDLWKTLD